MLCLLMRLKALSMVSRSPPSRRCCAGRPGAVSSLDRKRPLRSSTPPGRPAQQRRFEAECMVGQGGLRDSIRSSTLSLRPA
ncbi:hypothetical protein DD682_04180 [Bifidobacterium animalis subsp. lactis]|nr:hypothetical protein [Bifidobacterium animalis subsp. lactis]PVV48706.1 hypothetical protein DD682_04180 [Bifidobacterium animalis subsp. lactis]PVV65962.1 hypothetical protein DD693_04960 [Bifidobacterium animalis]